MQREIYRDNYRKKRQTQREIQQRDRYRQTRQPDNATTDRNALNNGEDKEHDRKSQHNTRRTDNTDHA